MRLLFILFFFTTFTGQAQDTKYYRVGDTLPDFSYQGTFQKPYHLSELKGSYVLVHFWASWNTESRNLQREMALPYTKYKDKKFRKGRKFYIISISLDESIKLHDLALKKDNLPWKNHQCDQLGWDSPIVKNCRIARIPYNFLLSPEGVVLARNINAAELEQLLGSY